MAYVNKTDLERVAESIFRLNWEDMIELASHFASVGPDEDEQVSDHYWAGIINDWANAKNDEYIARSQQPDPTAAG